MLFGSQLEFFRNLEMKLWEKAIFSFEKSYQVNPRIVLL
jgi:hypothetical protein